MTFWNDRKSNGIVSFPRQKGCTDTLPADAQLPAVVGPMSVVPATARELAERLRVQSNSRPCLSRGTLYALTIFLVLFGLGERLSHYRANPDPSSQNLVVKYWVDQQTDLKHAHLKMRVQPRSWVDQSICLQPQPTTDQARVERTSQQQSAPLRLEKVLPLLPLRSPPSISFLA